MLGAVHAAIGAGVGSLFNRKDAAFVSGVVSHLIADALPHKDFEAALEVPLVAGMMAAIAKWHGVDSPQFWGAFGGVLPDAEHGLFLAGIIEPEQEVFPTHVPELNLHGPETNERWSQLLLAAAGLALAAVNRQGARERTAGDP